MSETESESESVIESMSESGSEALRETVIQTLNERSESVKGVSAHPPFHYGGQDKTITP